MPVTTGRATVIDVGDPLGGPERAAAWLAGAGALALASGLEVLGRALQAYRIAAADPRAHGVGPDELLVARLGYGAGEQVADGLWTDARDLTDWDPAHPAHPRRPRRRVPVAQARFAAILTGRRAALACEELALRARLDLDERREREAALQLLIALDAARAELPADSAAAGLGDRLAELDALHEGVASAARSALGGSLGPAERATTEFALGRIEAALRARSAAFAE